MKSAQTLSIFGKQPEHVEDKSESEYLIYQRIDFYYHFSAKFAISNAFIDG